MGLKWSKKFPKVKNESNCVPGWKKEIPGCSGTRLADFQPQFAHHGAGNSQRGGHPWLLISSHIMVLLGLHLGTHTSTFKQKLRAAPVHLNKHLRDKTPPRTWDQSPASIPTPPPPMPALRRENPSYWSPRPVATTSPSKYYRRKKPSPSAGEERSLSRLSALSFHQTGAPGATSTDRGRRLQAWAGTGASLSITDGNLSGNHHKYMWPAE